MVDILKETGKMILNLVKELMYFLLEMFIKDFMLMENQKDKVLINGLMVKFIMDSGVRE